MLKTVGLPKGFDIGDLHLIFDDTYGGTVDKTEFLKGMTRLIFNNEFQRDCCTLLTVAQVKQEVKKAFVELKQELKLHREGMRKMYKQAGGMEEALRGGR